MQSLKRAFKILKILQLHGNAKLSEIATGLPVESNTAWNILNALIKLGYVRKNKRNSYSLGNACISFFSAGTDCKIIMKPYLEDLCKNIKESVMAVNLAGTGIHIMQRADYRGRVIISDEMHSEKNVLYYWATGRIIMAWQPDCVIKNIIEKCGFPSGKEWHGINSQFALLAKLRDIRVQGFAERLINGVYSLAVPVFDVQGNFHFALGVVYNSSRESKVHRQTIISHLLFSSKKLANIF